MGLTQILKRTISMAIVFVGVTTVLFAQKKQALPVNDIINSRHFIFKVQSVSPSSGLTRQLNTGYTLRVAADTVIADLPYFGRAYSAPADLTGGGINFTSLKPGYSAAQDKKNRWQITMKPQDVSEVENLSLTVFDDGTADLIVINRDRQPITFRGYIVRK